MYMYMYIHLHTCTLHLCNVIHVILCVLLCVHFLQVELCRKVIRLYQDIAVSWVMDKDTWYVYSVCASVHASFKTIMLTANVSIHVVVVMLTIKLTINKILSPPTKKNNNVFRTLYINEV